MQRASHILDIRPDVPASQGSAASEVVKSFVTNRLKDRDGYDNGESNP
jgi:hypothetical protein